MFISDLIKRLEDLREKVGEVVVESRNPAGEFGELEEAEIVNTSRKDAEVKWRVFLES